MTNEELIAHGFSKPFHYNEMYCMICDSQSRFVLSVNDYSYDKDKKKIIGEFIAAKLNEI